MKKLLSFIAISISLILLLTLSFYTEATIQIDNIPCNYGTKFSCPQEMYCVFTNNPKQAVCKNKFKEKLPELFFPFGPNKPVKCWKSTDHNKNSSHAWLTTKYAVDLHSERGKESPVYAAVSGKVKVFKGCEEKKPSCNNGFGNQVKIFSNKGFMIYYAHLGEVKVKTGDKVKMGQLIGKEGATGNVGGMWGTSYDFHHLHFSVHYNWKKHSQKLHKNSYPVTASIPFKVNICDPKETSFCKPISIDIRNLNCTKSNKRVKKIIGSGY